jgi:hypothetical protein
MAREKTADETIEILRANGFQYASAGDARRLINEIEKLREIIKKNRRFDDGA